MLGHSHTASLREIERYLANMAMDAGIIDDDVDLDDPDEQVLKGVEVGQRVPTSRRSRKATLRMR